MIITIDTDGIGTMCGFQTRVGVVTIIITMIGVTVTIGVIEEIAIAIVMMRKSVSMGLDV